MNSATDFLILFGFLLFPLCWDWKELSLLYYHVQKMNHINFESKAFLVLKLVKSLALFTLGCMSTYAQFFFFSGFGFEEINSLLF